MNPPDPEILASSFSATQRRYIELMLTSTLQEIVEPLVNSAKSLLATNKAQRDKINELELRINKLESRFKDDDRFLLTRGKIVALMKELNIQ